MNKAYPTAALAAHLFAAAFLAGPVAAQQAWALMERHGGCVSLAEAAARKPELQAISGPDELIAKLQAQGVAVHRQDIDAGGARAVIVDAPSRGLNVIFVPTAKCR